MLSALWVLSLSRACLLLLCTLGASLALQCTANADPLDPLRQRDPYASHISDHPSALTPRESATLSGEREAWRSRALSWYQSDDLRERRAQMRSMIRPLRRSCYYCHTKNFKGYVEARYMISLQMMAISAEQGVSCAECHIGRRGLTELGAKSLIQWRMAHEEGRDCRDCHLPQGRFRKLNQRGERARSRLVTTLEQRGAQWGVGRDVIQKWIERLKTDNISQQMSPSTTSEASTRPLPHDSSESSHHSTITPVPSPPKE